ncbi:MAG: hypothetical protein WEC79_09060 [Thermomicrobiales bacterium]
MGKSKGKGSAKQKGSRKGADGSAEIKRAEERLSAAFADVDAAREKVARRERDLAASMERYGRTVTIGQPDAEAIPLAAPSLTAIENGSAHTEPESVEPATAEEPAAAHDGDHHG